MTFGWLSATYSFDDDPLISRSHVRAHQPGEGFFLKDLGSGNRTLVWFVISPFALGGLRLGRS